MFQLTVGGEEFFDEEKQEFIYTKEQTLTLEHSLLSISKWEAKWKKPYFSKDKTDEEALDYVECMLVSPKKVDKSVFRRLSRKNYEEIADYINDPMTATKIYDRNPRSHKNNIITSEIIYYWMIAQNIPIECEKWPLNRLLTLIRVCSIKNDPNPKKMNRSAIARQNRALNQARRAKYNTRG